MKPIDDINNLQGLREELRLQAHLFKKELKDVFDTLENRWRDLEPKLASIDKGALDELLQRYLHVKKAAAEAPEADPLTRTFDAGFDDVLANVKDTLKKEGFGVLTQIDMQDTLKQKISSQIAPYRILGACHPALAHRALQEDPRAGVAMPCNVVVFEQGKRVVVCAVDPMQTIAPTLGGAVLDVAVELRAKLVRVLGSLQVN